MKKSLALLLLLAGAVAADVVPDGYKGVRHEITIDLGKYADYATRPYTIAEKDTLSEIAQRELGGARLVPQIVDLNPGIRPEALRPGEQILLPPQKAAGKDTPPWLDFFLLESHGPRRNLSRLGQGGKVDCIYGFRVVAVPHDRVADFLKETRESLDKADYFAVSDTHNRIRNISEGDKTATIRTTYLVEEVRGRAVSLKQSKEERIDEAGKPVKSSLGGDWLNLGATSLALLGLLGLLALRGRRRRA